MLANQRPGSTPYHNLSIQKAQS